MRPSISAFLPPPSTMVVGWYDPFLPFQIADYLALRDAGCQVRLCVGPWWHTRFAGMAAALEDGIDFFDSVLGGLAWVGIGRVREDAAMSSLAPSESVANTEKVPEGAS